MKKVKVPGTVHGILKLSTINVIVFCLLISLSSFKSANNNEELEKRKSEKPIEKCQDQNVIPDSTSELANPYATQLNSRAVPFVQKYIRSDGARLEKMKVWGKDYFKIYDQILSDNGLPKELKYLSVIESELVAKATSRCGAKGPWQIMGVEARRLGLRVNSRVDERTNFRKSTHAAAKFLKELYTQFNDWPLVIAAYNCGAGRVRKAMRKSGSKNFWYLQSYLPFETRRHVKRFISTHYIFEGSGGLTTMTASEVEHYKLKIAPMQVKPITVADESIVANLSTELCAPNELVVVSN